MLTVAVTFLVAFNVGAIQSNFFLRTLTTGQLGSAGFLIGSSECASPPIKSFCLLNLLVGMSVILLLALAINKTVPSIPPKTWTHRSCREAPLGSTSHSEGG